MHFRLGYQWVHGTKNNILSVTKYYTIFILNEKKKLYFPTHLKSKEKV